MKSIIHIYANEEDQLDAQVWIPDDKNAIMEINLVLDMIKSDMVKKALSLTRTEYKGGVKCGDTSPDEKVN